MTNRPFVVLHNSVSIDGSLTGFEPDMELHYQLAGAYQADVHLIGSQTVVAGVTLYGDGVPAEEPADCKKPTRDPSLPLWAIVDTRGRLQGMLHCCRRFDFCRDVVVCVSTSTPEAYLEHLRERDYPVVCAGEDHVDVRKLLDLLSKQYGVTKILVDTGRVLGNVLLSEGVVDEVSLLVHPVVVGTQAYTMFSDILQNQRYTLVKAEVLRQQFVRLVYRPVKG